jgi:TetR/AcrR family transcriptional regulator, repressor for uid operon
MTAVELVVPIELPAKAALRRDAILNAAQQVFTAKGFELATMQDVAAECNMSAGNLYRYFPSKSAIVSGLVEHDMVQMAERFAELAKSPDPVESFEKLGRQHLKQECAENAKLRLEIWAAASRRPELRDLCMKMEDAIHTDLELFVQRIIAEGRVEPGVDSKLICNILMMMVHGLFRDAALHSVDSIERGLDIMFATLKAAFAGHIKLPEPQTRVNEESHHDHDHP